MKKETFIVLLYFIFAACYSTFPLVLHLTTSLPHDGDELFITWVLNWNIHSLFTNPLDIYNANIFYPYHYTLAYSESFLTSSLIGLIPYSIFGQPAAVYNMVLLFSYTTLGFCTFLLVRYLSKSLYAGVISGTLAAFSTYTITKTMHLQLIGIALLPLSIFFFLQFLDTKKIRYICFVALCFIFQMANSFLPAYFILFSLFFIWVSYYFSNKKKFFLLFQKKVFLIGIITVVCNIPLVLPYFWVSQQFHYARDIRDAIHFANRIEYTFYPSDRSRLQDILVHTLYAHDTGPYGYDGYIGLAFFTLTFFMLYYSFFRLKKSIPYLWVFISLGFFGFILSLGPALQWGGKVIKFPFLIPLPYALFYYILPGFNGMRNSARWEMLFLFSFSVAIGLFLSFLFKRYSLKTSFLLTVSICVVVLLEIPLPMHLTAIPPKEKIPMTYYYLNTLSKNTVVAEMPIYVWYMSPYANKEVYREYFSTIDFRKRINGTSGFSPLVWEEQTRELLINFPNNGSIEKLRKLGVTTLVVHTDEYNTLSRDKFTLSNHHLPDGLTIIINLEKQKKIRLLKRFGADYVYTLL